MNNIPYWEVANITSSIKHNGDKGAQMEDKYLLKKQLEYMQKLIYLTYSKASRAVYLDALVQVLSEQNINHLAEQFLSMLKKARESKMKDDILAEIEAEASVENEPRKVILWAYKLNVYAHKKLDELLIKALKSELERLNYTDSHYESRVKKIQESLGLKDIEVEIMNFFYFMDTGSYPISDMMTERSCAMDLKRLSMAKSFFKQFFNMKKFEVTEVFSKKGILFGANIIERSSGYSRDIGMSDQILGFLESENDVSLFEFFADRVEDKSAFTLEDFDIPEESKKLLVDLLLSDQPQNILFYGPSGSGKTELAKLLGEMTKEHTYILKSTDEDGESSLRARQTGMITTQKQGNLSSLNIFDEADTLTMTRNYWGSYATSTDDKKSFLNNYLETSTCHIIWIVNELSQMDPSLPRRFSHVVKFKEPSVKQRSKAIGKHLEDESFLTEKEIYQFAKEFDLSIGNIAKAVKDVNKLGIDDETKKEHLRVILNEKLEISGKKKSKFELNNPHYDVTALNTDIPVERILKSAQGFLENEGGQVKNLTLLLDGPPGTGKTEMVKWLADQLELEIIYKRPSDIISKWVGGTEANLRQAFDSVERNSSLLFLDEIDSILRSRELAERSWEATQVNELLLCLESFGAIAVFGTNFKKNLDRAALRRFNMKVSFDYLSEEGKQKMAQRWFGNLEERDKKALTKISKVCPGDFKVVKEMASFEGDVPVAELITRLKEEVKYKKEKTISL